MAKKLFSYWISPGDEEHMAWAVQQGVVEAEEAEIKAIARDVKADFGSYFRVTPIEDEKIDVAKFRAVVGEALAIYHGEELGNNRPCEKDRPYLEAHLKADYSPADATKMLAELYAKEEHGTPVERDDDWDGE